MAGVARGLGDHLGVPTVWVRIGFVLLAFASGAGLVMYAAFWIVVPQAPDPVDDAPVDDSPSARDRDLLVLLGVGAVAVGAASLASRQGLSSALLVPVMVVAVGVAVLWRQGDDAQRLRWRSHATRAAWLGGRGGWLRVLIGVVLVLTGLAWVVASTGDVALLADGLAAGADPVRRPRPGGRSLAAPARCASSPRSGANASVPRSGPSWPRTSTTRSCRRSRSSSATPRTRRR